ncbi:uncharacterized protein LOC134838172 [Culicoides brevitarsis]|uniref:uncharacterized protein LOC134838172 n=1 Tax=Culicoides brevitarsis TaxID=469753 RepID=UPI00307BB2AC
MSALKFIDSSEQFLTNAIIGDDSDDLMHSTTSHVAAYDDGSDYEHAENSCDDNNDNSLNVTGEQNLSHMHDNGNDDDVATYYGNDVPEQNQQKALISSGNEMRQRKNLLFNLINSIMKYLGSRQHDNDCGDDSKMKTVDRRGSDKLIIMDEYDRFNNSCDNRNNKVSTTMDDNKGEIEFMFDRSEECQTEVAIVPKTDAYAVTLISVNSRMRVALGVLIRLLLPVANKVSNGWNDLRGSGMLRLLNKIRETKGLMTTLLAFAANTLSMSLSSVQVTNRFDPILRKIKLKKDQNALTPCPSFSSELSRISISSSSSSDSLNSLSSPITTIPKTLSAYLRDEPTEKCVSCVVMAEPPAGETITADIVFIHGLHGSLVNTWKQGLWKSEGRLEGFDRPPKPPIRPPKRQRHSRSTLVVPSIKRARYSDAFDIQDDDGENDTFELKHKTQTVKYDNKQYTYECGDIKDVQYMDDVEYSFPTFRLRLDDLNLNETVKQGLRRTSEAPNPKNNLNYSKCWPGDWLPMDCPGVRVLSVNYTTDPYLWRPAWVRKRSRSNLVDRAREMTDLLIEKGVGKNRPIIWVGHSKGGLFIKQILVDAWERGRPEAKDLFTSSRGCFFYSVPHRGSSLADFNLPLLRQSVELREIQKDCSSLLDLHHRFVALYRAGHLKVDVFSFVETALTLMSVLYLRIVTIDSADPGIGEVCGVHLDHREICKPRGRDCLLYTELVKMINNVKF